MSGFLFPLIPSKVTWSKVLSVAFQIMINQDPHHPWTAPDRPKFFDHDPPASALYSSAGRDKQKKFN